MLALLALNFRTELTGRYGDSLWASWYYMHFTAGKAQFTGRADWCRAAGQAYM